MLSCAQRRTGAAVRGATGGATGGGADEGSHKDFQPVYHAQDAAAGSDVKSLIESDIKAHRVFVYMKGVPDAPQCGFSNMVCRILDHHGADYGSRNVLADAAVREGIKEFTSWPTIPQIFIDGEFVGGCDILMSMHQEGELAEALPKDD